MQNMNYLAQLLVIGSLLDKIEDLGGEGLVGQRVRLGVHLVVGRSHLDLSVSRSYTINLNLVITDILKGILSTTAISVVNES